VKLLWSHDWWDGVLSGICECHGKKMWFQVCSEILSEKEAEKLGWWRRYLLLELKPEEFREEEKWHNLFREKVGTHTDYDENERRGGEVSPETTWHEFYDEFNPVRDDLSNYHQKREPYGYFEM